MDIFIEISLILVVATAVALLMQRLRQPLIIGHIISGILLGPFVLNLIHAKSTIQIFSQFGITILLFLVGLNLSPAVIREVGKASLITGLGQMIVTTLAGGLVAMALGFSLTIALYLGVALAFSSTIIVSKHLTDKKDLNKLYGKIAVGMLLVQDVIAVFALIALATLQKGAVLSQTLYLTLLAGALAIAVVFLVSVYLLPVLTRLFAASQEFLFLFAVGWGLGIAALFQFLGFTGEIGALVAGIALAASPYHYEISSKMKMLRDFFLVLFFVLLGSQLTFAGLAAVWFPALVFSLVVLIVDPLIVMVLMGVLGYNKKTGFMVALTVAQISEFSILLILFASRAGAVSANMLTLMTLVGLVTIAISSYLLRYSDKLYHFFEPVLSVFERRHVIAEQPALLEKYPVILFGHDRVGLDFLPVLRRRREKFLVVDFNPEIIRHLTKLGIPCRYGDAQDDEFLNELGLAKIRMVISTIPDFDTNAFLVDKLRKRNRQAVAIVTAHSVPEAMSLYDAGATYVVMPHFLGGNYASILIDRYGANGRKFASERRRHLRHLKSRT